ncbi:MAG: hypothetical protein ABIH76_05145 [Candidatus Bathyarchaeota archaeon]
MRTLDQALPPPNMVIQLKEGGISYTGQFSLTYVCDMPGEGDNSPIDEREIEFACNGGQCTNDGWFYKLNPCFSGAEGHFIYRWNGEEKKTNSILVESETEYEFNLDLGDAALTKTSEQRNSPGTPCPLTSLLLAGSLLMVFRS